MKKGYKVTCKKIDRKTNKPDYFEFIQSPKFETVRECYEDCQTIIFEGLKDVDSLKWILPCGVEMFNYMENTKIFKSIKKFTRESEKYIIEVQIVCK